MKVVIWRKSISNDLQYTRVSNWKKVRVQLIILRGLDSLKVYYSFIEKELGKYYKKWGKKTQKFFVCSFLDLPSVPIIEDVWVEQNHINSSSNLCGLGQLIVQLVFQKKIRQGTSFFHTKIRQLSLIQKNAINLHRYNCIQLLIYLHISRL